MVTESEISRSWSRLFKDGLSEEVFASAEEVLKDLRAESPLRFRLEKELDELRHLHAAQVKA